MNPKDFEEREAFFSQAEAMLGEKRYQAVLDLAARRSPGFPVDAESDLMLCRAWIGLDDPEKAEAILDGLDRWVDLLSDGFFKTAKAFHQAGFTGEALRCYRRALALNPESPLAAVISDEIDDLALREHQGPVVPEALDTAAPLSQIGPDFYTMTLAELYIRQGHLEMASDVLEQMVRKDPADGKAAARLSEVRIMIGERQGDGFPQRRAAVIEELERWLRNLDRIKGYAA
ncbi:MAG: tetratricopeptide repeat protein [Deltaproteobacteria bacterium]|nr:tetratricopeptide repeat protein [Deltaproteobacteria bacterium]